MDGREFPIPKLVNTWDLWLFYLLRHKREHSPPACPLSPPLSGDGLLLASLCCSSRKQNIPPSESPHCASGKHILTMGSLGQPIRDALCIATIHCQADWKPAEHAEISAEETPWLQSVNTTKESRRHLNDCQIYKKSLQFTMESPV